MQFTIIGSGGCMVIPKPLCRCKVCSEAREKGIPYARTGPSLFLHDIKLLIDTPAEISAQLNRENIESLNYLMFTHLDPDHIEGFRVVEQICIDFRTWRNYPDKQIKLVLPEYLMKQLDRVQSSYGPLARFYEEQGFIECCTFEEVITLGNIKITAIPVDRGGRYSYIFVFNDESTKVVYAPCDIKPFPENLEEVRDADLVIIQPGIFEKGLKHDFNYPSDHISRTTLYTFHDTLALCERINAVKVLFVHLEEYWNRSHDDYLALEKEYGNIQFAWDGLQLEIKGKEI